MTIKTKAIDFEVKAVNDDGFFSGYCSVFDNVDSYGDVVKKGAYTDSLSKWQSKSKMPPILWQHDRSQVIGVWTKLFEDEHGLYGEGRLLIDDVAKAKEAHALMKHGAIDGLSIGYSVDKWKHNKKDDTMELLAIDLKEVSVVTFPANEESRIDSVKSTLQAGELPTLSEFEKFLREAGFSKSQATAIAGHGLRSLIQSESEVKTAKDDGLSEVLDLLKNLNK